MTRLVAVLMGFALLGAAQAQTAAIPLDTAPLKGAQFDAVSIKPNETGSGHSHLHTWSDNADLAAENISLSGLVQYAYDVPGTRILSSQAIMKTAHFDIQAKAENAVNEQAKHMESKALDGLTKEMARTLLAERFQLVVHREKKELPVYELEVAKSGLKLTSSDVKGTHVTGRLGSLTVQGISVPDLCDELGRQVGRVVVDNTGLTGRFDGALRWTPEDGPPPMLNGEPDTSWPSIYTAIQEQMGLKLEPRKAPVDVLVVDRVELPTAN
jgi:uncharacterized protein (TIGR03435 family)